MPTITNCPNCNKKPENGRRIRKCKDYGMTSLYGKVRMQGLAGGWRAQNGQGRVGAAVGKGWKDNRCKAEIVGIRCWQHRVQTQRTLFEARVAYFVASRSIRRSEEHTSELQSPCNLVCRLLLEKKNQVA